MRNFVFISPNFPTNYESFVVQLRLKGFRVLGIGDTPFHQLSHTLQQNLAYYYPISSLHNYDEVYQAMAYLIYTYGRIDFLESHNEFWLELDARLRTDFNIFGIKNDTIDTIRSKMEMKKIFRKAKVAVAQGRLVTSYASAKNFVKQVNFPIIIKPDRGVGATKTYRIENDEDLKHFFDIKDSNRYIMEEFIDKNVVSFDGLVDLSGNIVYCSSLIYHAPLLDIVDSGADDVYFYTQRKIPVSLMDTGKRAISAFNLKGRFFHLELFDLGNDAYMALELNCRPVGGYGLDCMNYANDIDLYAQYANLMNHQPFSQPLHYPYYCGYVARRFYKQYKYSLEDLHRHYPQAIVQVSRVPYVLSHLMGDQAIIIRHQDLEVLKTLIDQSFQLKTD